MAFLVLASLASLFMGESPKVEKVSLNKIIQTIAEENVVKITVMPDKLQAKLKDGKILEASKNRANHFPNSLVTTILILKNY